MCRPGIILYGLTPSSGLKLKEDFIPAMTVKSVVSMVKTVKKGDTVSYGRTFTAEREMKTATVTAGYADGYPRLLSNKGYVLIKGKKAPIIGRICMDQMSVDVTDIENVKQGDEVILFGRELPVEELADTVSYTHLHTKAREKHKSAQRLQVFHWLIKSHNAVRRCNADRGTEYFCLSKNIPRRQRSAALP